MNAINKLFDKYKGSAPIGFGSLGKAVKRRPVIFTLDGGEADAVCVRHGLDIDKVQADVKGVYLDAPCACKECSSADVPFAVFKAENMPLSVQFSDDTAKIALVDPNIDMAVFSGLSALPVDAYMLENTAEKLTWGSLSQAKKFAALGKPVIMEVPLDVSIEELQNLYTAGVRGFAIKGNSTEIYKEVQNASWQVNKEKKDVILGSAVPVAVEPSHEQEDEDDF